jgi:hypothetical protein
MLLFRSEGHLDRWLQGRPKGAVLPVLTLVDLAYAWWGDRLDPAWRPHTREHNQAILDRLGLTGAFWDLG